MARALRLCGALLGWRQIQGILLRDSDGYFESRCPSCGWTRRQKGRPKQGQRCVELVRVELVRK